MRRTCILECVFNTMCNVNALYLLDGYLRIGKNCESRTISLKLLF